MCFGSSLTGRAVARRSDSENSKGRSFVCRCSSQKAELKKLVLEKLGPEALGGENYNAMPAVEDASPLTPEESFLVEEIPGASEGWVDVRVEQQAAPVEEKMVGPVGAGGSLIHCARRIS